MQLVLYSQPYFSEFRYNGAGNNDFFQVLHTRWFQYIAKQRAEDVRGSFSESHWNFKNKYQCNWPKVFIFDGLFGWYKSKANFVKPSIISSSNHRHYFPMKQMLYVRLNCSQEMYRGRWFFENPLNFICQVTTGKSINA